MNSPKTAISFLFASLLIFTSALLVSCNDNADKTETTTAQPEQPIDTTHMDTASTRPVKTTN